MYSCLHCSSKFKHKHNLTRHTKTVHTSDKLKCDQCKSSFGGKDELAKHKHRKHTLQKCGECDFITYEKCGLEYHMLGMHENEEIELTNRKKTLVYIL